MIRGVINKLRRWLCGHFFAFVVMLRFLGMGHVTKYNQDN